ncbi:hypothetical protein ACTFIZ_002749 [Dictyostelium cf. discoideum]
MVVNKKTSKEINIYDNVVFEDIGEFATRKLKQDRFKHINARNPLVKTWKPLWLIRLGSSTGLIIALSASGGLIFGYNTGIIGPALGHINNQYHLNTILQGLVVCSTLFGALIGSVSGGFLADWLGRKPVVLLTAIVTIGGAISSSATNPLSLVASLRIILGLGVGISSGVCPLMVAEVVPVEKRGVYGSVFQLFITLGLLWANVMGLLLIESGIHNWRWMFAIGSLPGFFMLICWTVLNESPVWIENQRLKKERKLQEMAISNSKPKKSAFKILMEKKNRRPLFIGVILATFQQLTGINAFMYFSNLIFFKAGFTGEYGAITCSCILQFWNVSFTIIAALTVDHLGRRPLLFIGSIVMTIADLLIALFYVALTGKVQGWLSIVCLFIFVAAFAMSIGTLFWFIVNEIFDPEAKDLGAPILVGLQWLFNMLLSLTFVGAVPYIGDSTMFWIFGGIGITCIVLLAIFLPPEKIQQGELESDVLPKSLKQASTVFDDEVELSPSEKKNNFYIPKEEAEEVLENLSEIPSENMEIPRNIEN